MKKFLNICIFIILYLCLFNPNITLATNNINDTLKEQMIIKNAIVEDSLKKSD